MLIIFGGVVSGTGAAIALKSGASTGGTDFIALWVSNHTGKTIWGVIFGFNCFILAIFGFMFGWDNAAYSIVFQFISTKTIDSFYRRYDRVTLQITTREADEVMTAYVNHFQHGISCAEVIGGYSREKDVPAAHRCLDLREPGYSQAGVRRRPRRRDQCVPHA